MFPKKVIIAVAVVVLACVAVMPVSAAYVDMLDHGLYFSPDNYSSGDARIYDSGGAGTYTGTVHAWVPMWALDSYEPGKTYTMEFSCVVPAGVNVSFNYEYIVLQHENVNVLPLEADLPKAYHSASFDQSTGKLTFVVKFNTDVSDLGGYPVYIYLYSVVNSQIYNKMITNQWSTSVETDSGGSQYIQDLVDEVATIRQNDETYHSNALEVLDGIKSGIDGMPNEIKNVLEQHDQQQKQEANTEGNDNINQATSALTNALPVASISDAIAPLVTACGYNGITSVWSFPAMKIPAIAGLFDEIQLNEVQNFDLCAYAQQYIPDELLQVIRAIMTIMLIVWAIREVQGLFSHLLGGGDG